MDASQRAADDQIQESELVSVLDGPKQSQASGNKMINVNLVHVAVDIHQESCTSEGKGSRRKCRKRSFSPEVETVVRRKARKKINLLISKSGKKAGVEFCCDVCKSPSITNPSRRGNRLKQSGYRASPRWKSDPETGKMLMLCNACGLAFGRSRRLRSSCTDIDAGERRKHEEALEAFAVSMMELLGDQDAKMLCCPLFVKKPCQCLQNYIKRTGDELSESRHRAMNLLQLLKEARRLSLLKYYDENQVHQLERHRKRCIGLGNGQRKSKAFEEFVLKHRMVLKNELKLCERATQRILGYSNNFLHKKLKTDPQKGKRIKRTKGKGALGLLKPIAELVKERCCMDNCVLMARTHGRLLQFWRERASKGQADARRALAEMLTPSGGSHSNCYKFISWVTGCSHSTISRVNEQMRRTGGEREPTPHGLKKCWKEKPKAQGMKSTEQNSTGVNMANFLNSASAVVSSGPSFPETIQVSISKSSLPVELSSLPPTVQLQIQRQQIEALKKQVQDLQQQQLQLQWEVTRAQPQPPHLQVFGTPDTLIPQPLSVHQPSSVITHRQPVGLQAKAMQQQDHVSRKGLAIAQIPLKPGHPQMVSAVQSISILQDGLQKKDVQTVQCQIQQDQQRKQHQQFGALQQLESGTVDGLVCNQSEAQQEAMAHLQHSPVQKNSLTQCQSTEEQFLKQLAPSNLQQALQLITVTEDCQTPPARVHR